MLLTLVTMPVILENKKKKSTKPSIALVFNNSPIFKRVLKRYFGIVPLKIENPTSHQAK